MIVAKLFQGPFDGELIALPAPVETFVLAEFDPIVIEFIYLLSGELEDAIYAYLYGEDLTGL